MYKKPEVTYNKELERIEIIFRYDEDKGDRTAVSPTYITDKMRADPILMCTILEKYIEKQLRALGLVKDDWEKKDALENTKME